MSDSDTDLLSNNVLTFQSQGTTMIAKGPNINNTNISSISFRNNVMTSTMSMPWNIDRPRYAESAYDQRSMYYRRERETTPMSLHSASGMQSRNHSYYPGAMSSHRSMYNGRSGSPMSVRTIDSNTSMSAKDIAFAFQNGKFTKFDVKMIIDAYNNRFMKSRTRKRVDKRRRRPRRRRRGGDSGDQASNSSISSDDCRSTRTSRSTIYNESMSSCRSTKTDISDFRRIMRDSNMVRDFTESFKQNSSMFPGGPTKDKEQKWQNSSLTSLAHTQKDRFKSGFLLPSQRFNQSVASWLIPEKPYTLQRINEGNTLDIPNNVPNPIERNDRRNDKTDSEQEEIFADVTVSEKPSMSNKGKRSLEGDDIPEPNKKRTKLSPIKNNPKPKAPKQNQPNGFTKQKCNEFVFAKPQLPLKKPTIAKQQIVVSKTSKDPKAASLSKEKQPITETILSTSVKNTVDKLISKSLQPLDPVQYNSEWAAIQKLPQSVPQVKEQSLPSDITQHSTTDMSMRPSFIKRKLFTQKVDVAEKNSSSDSLHVDSPQTNVYSKIQKDKNRTRKLVTTQSCLNRDVQDDSNLLDLIHKIVPADQMNVTTAANRTETQNNNKSKPINAEKWDVTSIITTCNNTDDLSDTYTDEDIFAREDSEKQDTGVNKQTKNKSIEMIKESISEVKEKSAGKEKKYVNNEKQKVPQSKALKLNAGCKVVVEKLQPHNFKELAILNDQRSPTERNDLIKANLYKGVKSFWDTDAESDLEATPVKRVVPSAEVIAAAPLKNIIAPVTKVSKPPTSHLVLNKTKETMQKKPTKQKMNLSITKQKESKSRNQSQNPININQIVYKIAENKQTQKAIKTNKKALPASTKENDPPDLESNNATNNKAKILNTSIKPKKNDEQQKLIKKTTMDKAKLQINNNDSTSNNNESQHIKNHNNTLRIRAQRKPKINRCCGETDSSYQLKTNHTITLCRSLRSRQVDLSTFLESDDGDINVIKKTARKQKRPANNNVFKANGEKALLSDVSFTLTTEVSSNRTTRNRKTSGNSKDRNPRQSAVSFTLVTENKMLNDTVSTKRSKKNKEIESLQNNSASFMRSWKRSPLNNKMAAESRAMNRSSNMRLNRSRQLL